MEPYSQTKNDSYVKDHSNQPELPKKSLAFLNWFCPDYLLEGILGDLTESYSHDYDELGKQKADLRFTKNVLRFFHPTIILKNDKRMRMLNIGLLKSHAKISFRHILKNRIHSFINILGLSISIAFVLLVFLFIQNEMSFDQFHSEKNNIYRVYHQRINAETGDIKDQSAVTAIPLSKDLKSELPSIQSFTRLGSAAVTVSNNNIPFEEKLSFGDADFFKMFSFPIIDGDDNSLLSNPNSIVISKEKAQKYFGNKNPIGETLEINAGATTLEAIVSGVIDPKKDMSSIQVDMMMPFENFEFVSSKDMMTSYKYGLVENYIQTSNPIVREEFEELITDAIQKFSPAKDYKTNLAIQPLTTLHRQDQILGNTLYVSPKKLAIMLGIGLLVLIIATINFVTLSTGQAIGRIKEMGLRKSFGAINGQLRSQLALESFVIVILSLGFGLGLSHLFHDSFTSLTSSSFIYNIGWSELGFLAITGLVIAILTGITQAVLTVKHKMVDTFQGKVIFGESRDWFNKSLIVFQFTLSIILIIAAVHINAQMAYIKNKDLGYDSEKLIEISMGNPSSLEDGKLMVERFRTESKKIQEVLSVSSSMNNSREPWTELGIKQMDESVENIYYNQVDPHYIETMKIELVHGEAFKTSVVNNSNSILINEALARHFSWGDDALSRTIPGAGLDGDHQIIGVVKDYHFGSLHHNIEPLMIALDASSISNGITGLSTYVWPPNLYHILVRLDAGDVQPVLEELKEIWSRINPNKDFVYHFVDQSLEAKYAEEERWSKVINMASIFAIGLAWLGLFALLRLTIKKKKKEIGIRRVLGSSTFEITSLLSKKYIWLVLIGVIISFPISWWIVKSWLETFAYRIEINPILFAVSSAAILIFTLVTVSIQSINASKENPIEALASD